MFGRTESLQGRHDRMDHLAWERERRIQEAERHGEAMYEDPTNESGRRKGEKPDRRP